MPFAALDGVRRGCRAVVTTAAGTIRPSERWPGRVVNARAEPIDGQGPLPPGPAPYPYRSSPPPAHSRRRVGDPLDLGVRALNTFITVCRGQRMGIFSGSGVGKSVLLSMLMRRQAAYLTLAIARTGADGLRDSFCHDPARDRTLRRRAADGEGLYAHSFCGIAALA